MGAPESPISTTPRRSVPICTSPPCPHILFTLSVDGGATWSAPVRVNDDPITLKVDQMFPAVDVDKDGQLFVIFYDRRRDSRNFLTDTFVAKSHDAGQTWDNHRVTINNFAAIHDEDSVVNSLYMGDYLVGMSGSIAALHQGQAHSGSARGEEAAAQDQDQEPAA